MKRFVAMAAVVGAMASGVWGADWVKRSATEGFDVDFQGGSVAEYYEGIAEALTDANVVVHPDASRVAMPPVRVFAIHERSMIKLPGDLLRGVLVEASDGAIFMQGGDVGGPDAYWIVQIDPAEVTSWVEGSPFKDKDHPAYIELLEFPGGTVKEFVDLIRKEKGEFNIVMMPGVENVELPPMTLRGIMSYNAIALLDELRQTDGEPLMQVERSEQAWVLQKFDHRDREKRREVWNLSELLDMGLGEDGILRAVEMGLGSVGDGADVLYHEDTGLLLVVGTHPHVEVVDEVLGQMHLTAEVRQRKLMRLEQRLREREEIELDISRVRSEMQMLQHRIQMQVEAVEEADRLVEQNLMSRHDVREARVELQALEAELRIKHQEEEVLQRRYNALKEVNSGSDA